MAALLLAFACPVCAGSYSLPAFSGGLWYSNYASPGVPHPYSSYGNTTGSGDSSMQVQASGTVVATFTWVSSNTSLDPAPSCVVEQTGSAWWRASAPTQPPASCRDGLGDLESGGLNGGSSFGTHYQIVAPDANGVITIVLSGAQATVDPTGSTSGNFGCGITWSVYAAPITVRLNGTIKDTVGSDNILIGQGCTAYIQAGSLPDGAITFSNFNWTVPGVTFDHFYISSDQSQGHVVFADPAIWASASPFWYWNSSANYTVSVNATASVNGLSLGTLTAQKNVAVIMPSQAVVTVTGSSSFQKTNGTVTGIQAGAPGASGMEIDASVMTPNPIAQYGYYGKYFFVQLVKELRDLKMGAIVYPHITNGFVLDNQWPYNGYQDGYGPESVTPTHLIFSDAPDMGIQFYDGVDIADEFKAYLMYQPPGNGYNAQPVPIRLTDWNWTASATLYNGLWSPDPPGTCMMTADGVSSEFPEWTASFTNISGETGRTRHIKPILGKAFNQIMSLH